MRGARSGALALIAGASLSSTPAYAGTTTHYQVLLAGKSAGEQIVKRTDGERIDVEYRFNDRGRGPDSRTSYRLDADGLPVAISVAGLDYMKGTIDESFERKGDVAKWSGGAEQGNATGRGFYLALDAPPEGDAVLARALLRARDHRLPLLPTGEAHIDELERVKLNDGRELRHVEISGLEFEPEALWLNPDGTLYAMISGWITIVEDGGLDELDELRARQDERRATRFAEMAKRIRQVPSGPVLIDHARVLDVRTGRVRPENAVLVQDDRIVSLFMPGARRPEHATIVDAANRTLMPGLWDMHAHLDLMHGPLNIAAGVTTARDMANDHDRLTKIMQQFDAGTAIGPHVLRAGIIDGPGPFAGPTRALVSTEAEAATWVDFYAANGYQQVKIYSSVDPKLVPFIAARAHARGLRVSGHVPAGMWAEDAVRDGYDEIQHINMVFLNFYKDVTETRNRDRFIKVAERGAGLDFKSKEFLSFVDLLKRHHTVIDPTLAVLFDTLAQVPGKPAPSLEAVYQRLPALVARDALKGALEPPAGQARQYASSAQHMIEAVGALHAAGVRLVAGTDSLPGFGLHSELEMYVRAGIPAAEVLRIATIGAAEVMGIAREVGAIEPGMRADLILVDGQPDRDIAQIRKVNWVMKSGVMHDPAAIYRAIGVRPE